MKNKKLTPGTSLRKLAQIARKYKNKAPKDIVENLDKYLYKKV